MTRKERVLAAIRREAIDCVPFATYNLHGCMGAGHAQDDSYRALLALVRDKAAVYAKGGVSAKTGASGGTGPRRSRLTEQEGDNVIQTDILHTPKGDLRTVRVTPKDQPAYVTEHYIKTDRDIERYMSLPWEPVEYDAEWFNAFEAEVGDWGIVTAGYSDPMHTVCQLFDFEDFTVRCLTDLPAILRLVDHFYEQIAEDTRRRARAVRGRRVVFLTGGPEVATPPMMAPRAFEALVMPYQKKLIEIIHAEGHLAMIHCHGRVRDVLDYMLETGVDAIEPIEPPPQGDIGLAELLERTRGRMTVMGHIQDQELHYVPPGVMQAHVEQLARIVDGRTGYVMMPTCTPFQIPATPVWLRNYTEWVETAARVFGT